MDPIFYDLYSGDSQKKTPNCWRLPKSETEEAVGPQGQEDGVGAEAHALDQRSRDDRRSLGRSRPTDSLCPRFFLWAPKKVLGSPLKGSFKGDIGAYKGCMRLCWEYLSFGISSGPQYGPLAPLKGSELWAPILEVVCNGVIMAL